MLDKLNVPKFRGRNWGFIDPTKDMEVMRKEFLKAANSSDEATVTIDELKKKVVNPLKGKKIAAYYGCLLLRPGKTMQMDNPENPKILEDFIRAIGATPVLYPMRNECCGGYMTLNDKELAQKRSNAVVASALEQQADCMITACPLCRYNLVANATENQIPVYYFTELLAEALGVKEEVQA